MKTITLGLAFLILALSLSVQATAAASPYDEEARALEKLQKAQMKKERNNPAKGLAQGVKTATVDSAAEGISEGREAAADKGPIEGTLEGTRVGSAKAIETAAKGVFEVATLGYADTKSMKVQQPRKDSDEVTKFSIGF